MCLVIMQCHKFSQKYIQPALFILYIYFAGAVSTAPNEGRAAY